MADEQYDSRSEIPPQEEHRRWLAEIDEALKKEHGWRGKVKKVVKRFRDEREKENENSRFNILFSNVTTSKAAVYQTPPRADVRRRFSEDDGVSKRVAEVLERGLTYCIDEYDFDEEIMAAVDDFLIGGRGVVRIRYTPSMAQNPDGTEFIAYQDAQAEYVYWQDFLTSPARRWSDVRWCGFRHLMTKEELARLDPEAAETISLDYTIADEEDFGDGDDVFKRAEVWEIWDRDSGEVLYISRGLERVLFRKPDPLSLNGFFPIPKPLYGVTTTDSLTPVPEYALYQDLADELDTITERISNLVRMLKVRGVYDAAAEEIATLLEANDGELVAAKNAQALMEKGGIANVIQFAPLEPIIQALSQLYQSREAVKQTIYEVVGIADLLRGSSNAAETATAQRIKGQFGSMRLDAKKRAVARFARDVIRLKAEIIAEQFEPNVLQAMTGLPVDEDMMKVMRNDAVRNFRIDIETESTIAPDETAEQEAVTKLAGAITQFVTGVGPMVQSGAIDEQGALAMLRMFIRPFPGARNIENMLDEAETRQSEQEPKPDPQAAEKEFEQAKHSYEMQEAEAEHSNNMLELQIKRTELQAKALEVGMQVPMATPPPSAPPPQSGAGIA